MKVISIKQPWASLIVNGYKLYEFRTWKTKYRGKVLIHASKQIDKKEVERFKDLNLEYPTGCIIGEFYLDDCIKVNNDFAKELFSKDNEVYKNVLHYEGYAWKLEKVKKYNELIQINGKLGLWEIDDTLIN